MGSEVMPVEVATTNMNQPTTCRYGLDDEHTADVKKLAQSIVDGTAVLQSASVSRDGSTEDFMKTTLTVVLTERRG